MKIESIEKTKDLISKGVIIANADFMQTSTESLSNIVNGCGAANAKFDFVPDTIWGLDIAPACHIHDLAYFKGEDELDRKSADQLFLANLMNLIEYEKGWYQFILRFLRRRRALKYYAMVREFGKSAFYEGKK